MAELEYEPRPMPAALSIDESNGDETVILVPPLPRWRYWVLVSVCVMACLMALLGLKAEITRFSRNGMNWMEWVGLIWPLFGAVVGTGVCILVIRDRELGHVFRVAADSLHVRRSSTAGPTLGDWPRNEIKSIQAHLGPRLASGRRETFLRLTFADDKMLDLLNGHPIDEIRQIAAAICRRMGMGEASAGNRVSGSVK